MTSAVNSTTSSLVVRMTTNGNYMDLPLRSWIPLSSKLRSLRNKRRPSLRRWNRSKKSSRKLLILLPSLLEDSLPMTMSTSMMKSLLLLNLSMSACKSASRDPENTTNKNSWSARNKRTTADCRTPLRTSNHTPISG